MNLVILIYNYLLFTIVCCLNLKYRVCIQKAGTFPRHLLSVLKKLASMNITLVTWSRQNTIHRVLTNVSTMCFTH